MKIRCIIILIILMFYKVNKAQFVFDPTVSYYSQVEEMESYFDSVRNANPNDSIFSQEGSGYKMYNQAKEFWQYRKPINGNLQDYNVQLKTYFEDYSNVILGEDINNYWHEIGPKTNPTSPSNLQWLNKYNGIGPVEFVRISPNGNHNEMLTGSTNGGLFYSNDNGENWINANTDIQWFQSGCRWAEFDGNNANYWIAISSGQGDNTSSNIKFTGGVYRTLNKGVNWELIADYADLYIGGPNTRLNKILLPKAYPNKAFLATDDGLYKTDNYTATDPIWVAIIDNEVVYDIEFDEQIQRLYITTKSTSTSPKIKYSDNEGVSFITLPDPTLSAPSNVNKCSRAVIELSNADHNKLFCMYIENDIYDTHIPHYTYNLCIYDLTSNIFEYKTFIVNHRFGHGYSFAINQFNANIIYVVSGLKYLARDISINTYLSLSKAIHEDVEHIISNPFVQDELWVSTHGGPYKISGFQAAELKVNGLGIAEAHRGDQSESDPSKLIAGLYHDGTIITSSDYTDEWNPEWKHVFGGDGFQSSISNTNTNYAIAASQLGNYVWTNDYFNTTNKFSYSSRFETETLINQHKDDIAFSIHNDGYDIRRISFVKKGPINFHYNIISPNTLQTFLDNHGIQYGLKNNNEPDFTIWKLYSPSNYSNYLYAHIIVNINKLTEKHYLIRTKEADKEEEIVRNSWELLPTPVNAWYSKIEFALEDPNIVYFLGSTKNPDIYDTYGQKMVFKVNYSLNSTFANYTCPTGICDDFTFNLPNVTVGNDALAFENGSNERMYVATDVGIFYSDKISRSGSLNEVWKNISSNLPHVIVGAIEINYNANLLRCFLKGRGVWERKLNCTSIENLNLTTMNDHYNEATNNIISTSVLTGNDLIQYRAGNEVVLSNGFISNNNFHAFIRPCGIGVSSPGIYSRKIISESRVNNINSTQESIHLGKEYTLYPNPVSKYLYLKTTNENNDTDFRINDITGKLIKSGKTLNNSIDLSDLPNGVYFININEYTTFICVAH